MISINLLRLQTKEMNAQFQLGQMYEEGRGVEKNEKKAIEKYVNLVNKGRYSKKYQGIFGAFGKRCYKKKVRKEDWIHLVTDADAQFQLGQMYLEGRGVEER